MGVSAAVRRIGAWNALNGSPSWKKVKARELGSPFHEIQKNGLFRSQVRYF
jgi:hypothetical protein